MRFQAPSRSSIATLAISIGIVSGCGLSTSDTIDMDGPPPPDAQLVVSEMAIDSTWDTSGRTILLSFRTDWKIDSADFHRRSYRLGVSFVQRVPRWSPGPRSTLLPSPAGTIRDTLSCHAEVCYWTSPTVSVLAGLQGSQFLSVASRTLLHDGSTTP